MGGIIMKLNISEKLYNFTKRDRDIHFKYFANKLEYSASLIIYKGAIRPVISRDLQKSDSNDIFILITTSPVTESVQRYNSFHYHFTSLANFDQRGPLGDICTFSTFKNLLRIEIIERLKEQAIKL